MSTEQHTTTTRTIGVRSAIATLAATLWTAAPASAGPLVAPIQISAGSGCSLLGAYGSFGPLSAAPCGGQTLALDFQPPPGPVARAAAEPISSDLASAGAVGRGTTAGYMISAPAGVTINSATVSPGQTSGVNDGQGWSAYMFRAGSIDPLRSDLVTPDELNSDGGFGSSYFGIAMKCGWRRCTNPAQLSLNNMIITASETQGPTITPIAGSTNLWNQAGQWIWNAPGNDWSLELASADVTGVCALSAQVGATALADSLPAPNNSSWQECAEPSWTTAVDTRDSVPGAGSLPITIDATNAGQVTTPITETLNVDNDPVNVSLSTPNDPNPTVWVNHAVTVDAQATAGPSGISSTDCSTNDAPAQAYPAGGVTVNGDGVSTVSCTAWNTAVDPQGNHDSGSSSIAVHIDEAPPSLSLEAENPNDPTGVVADTSDSESGVAGGTIQMRLPGPAPGPACRRRSPAASCSRTSTTPA